MPIIIKTIRQNNNEHTLTILNAFEQTTWDSYCPIIKINPHWSSWTQLFMLPSYSFVSSPITKFVFKIYAHLYVLSQSEFDSHPIYFFLQKPSISHSEFKSMHGLSSLQVFVLASIIASNFA